MVNSRLRQHGIALSAILLLSPIVAACGGGESEPTAKPVPAAASAPTAAPAAELANTPLAEETAEQAESPLALPQSPLGQPESPLVLPSAEFGTQPLNDINLIAQLVAQQTPPPPAEGNASISGLLYSYSMNSVIRGTVFYLTPAIEVEGRLVPPTLYSGPQEENGDVAGTSDDYGRFAIDSVPPGVYYLAVWAPYDWILAFESQDASTPLQIQVEAGDQLDLNQLYVSWPNGG